MPGASVKFYPERPPGQSRGRGLTRLQSRRLLSLLTLLILSIRVCIVYKSRFRHALWWSAFIEFCQLELSRTFSEDIYVLLAYVLYM